MKGKNLDFGNSSFMEKRKSTSLSHINVEDVQKQKCFEKKKMFLSNRNLEDCQVFGDFSKAKDIFQKKETQNISLFLDNLIGGDLHPEMGCGLEANIEDLVKYYLKEKNDKEWNRILLCKLQKKYDLLQRRYALAENTIDSYRILGMNNTTKEFLSNDLVLGQDIPDSQFQENLLSLSFSTQFDSGFPQSERNPYSKMKKDQSKLSEISIKPDFPFNPSASDMMPPAMVQEIDQEIFFLREIYKKYSSEMENILSTKDEISPVHPNSDYENFKIHQRAKKAQKSSTFLTNLKEANLKANQLKEQSVTVLKTLQTYLEICA